MTKPARKAKQSGKASYPAAPWLCQHYDDRSDIEAHCNALNGRTIIGTFNHAPGIDAKATADFIVGLVNNQDKTEHLINEMTSALEICLESNSISWAAEHDADIALKLVRARAKR